jgi:oxygen-independent coproporphyrinogen-3 oxidase
LLRETGFSNLNLDLIFGIPGSSPERLRRDLDTVVALGPEHISCYCLIFEDGTPLHAMRERGLVFPVDEEAELAQYELVRAVLGRAGYRQYEISNFARPGRECRHNLLYWCGGEYYGLGPAAHGHVGGARFGNVRDLGAYCDAWLAGRAARAFEERLEPEAAACETLVMSLRRVEGVPRSRFRAETGYDYLDLRGAEIARLEELGLIEGAAERLRLTERGLFLSDSVFAELV